MQCGRSVATRVLLETSQCSLAGAAGKQSGGDGLCVFINGLWGIIDVLEWHYVFVEWQYISRRGESGLALFNPLCPFCIQCLSFRYQSESIFFEL